MNHDLSKAHEILQQSNFTCILCRRDSVRTDNRRGVSPLLAFLQEGKWTGYSAADKVVGKATAFLYVLMDIRAVYSPVMSEAAIRILKTHHIECTFQTRVEAILNRTHSGFCPMEIAVQNIEDPQQALDAVLKTLESLKSK